MDATSGGGQSFQVPGQTPGVSPDGTEPAAAAPAPAKTDVYDGGAQVDTGAETAKAEQEIRDQQGLSQDETITDQHKLEAAFGDDLTEAQLMTEPEADKVIRKMYGLKKKPIKPHHRRAFRELQQKVASMGKKDKAAIKGDLAKILPKDKKAAQKLKQEQREKKLEELAGSRTSRLDKAISTNRGQDLALIGLTGSQADRLARAINRGNDPGWLGGQATSEHGDVIGQEAAEVFGQWAKTGENTLTKTVVGFNQAASSLGMGVTFVRTIRIIAKFIKHVFRRRGIKSRQKSIDKLNTAIGKLNIMKDKLEAKLKAASDPTAKGKIQEQIKSIDAKILRIETRIEDKQVKQQYKKAVLEHSEKQLKGLREGYIEEAIINSTYFASSVISTVETVQGSVSETATVAGAVTGGVVFGVAMAYSGVKGAYRHAKRVQVINKEAAKLNKLAEKKGVGETTKAIAKAKAKNMKKKGRWNAFLGGIRSIMTAFLGAASFVMGLAAVGVTALAGVAALASGWGIIAGLGIMIGVACVKWAMNRPSKEIRTMNSEISKLESNLRKQTKELKNLSTQYAKTQDKEVLKKQLEASAKCEQLEKQIQEKKASRAEKLFEIKAAKAGKGGLTLDKVKNMTLRELVQNKEEFSFMTKGPLLNLLQSLEVFSNKESDGTLNPDLDLTVGQLTDPESSDNPFIQGDFEASKDLQERIMIGLSEWAEEIPDVQPSGVFGWAYNKMRGKGKDKSEDPATSSRSDAISEKPKGSRRGRRRGGVLPTPPPNLTGGPDSASTVPA